jgi:type IV secretion system protein TrbJ
MIKRILAIAAMILALAGPAGAVWPVFDASMFARQLAQLQEETAAVTNLAQQLQYIIKNTTGGGAGIWQSNGSALANLGGIIAEQEGLSYSVQGLAQQFQQLFPGYALPSTLNGPLTSLQQSVSTNLNTLNGALQSAQMQADNFQTEQATLANLELKNQAAIGGLQAVQTSTEVALAEVQQLQELRQLAMATMNSQNVAAANTVNTQALSQMTATAIMGAPNQIVTMPSGPGPTLPLVGGNIP